MRNAKVDDDLQRETLTLLISRYRSLFSDKLGCATTYVHRLKPTQDRPIIKHSYPIPYAFRDDVQAEVARMLEVGVIERSESPHVNPLRIVRKKDGRIRLCLDARHLNAVIEGDHEAPPRIDELMQRHHGVRFMSLIDLSHGYWQVPLHPDSRPLTAFRVGASLYHFCRVPFELKTAGSAFIRALRLALGPEFDAFVTTYIDDMLITSSSFGEHIRGLECVFKRLLQYNFTLNLEKSIFCQQSLAFLGFDLSTTGIAPNPARLDITRNFLEPRNKRNLQQFLGCCNYYRQFSIHYAKYVEPFRELLRKDSVWRWTDEHRQHYLAFKENFLRTVTLRHIEPNRPFRLQTDASDLGSCGVLYQMDDDGNPGLVSIVSRCLTLAEKRYTVTERELLVIIYAISKLRVYLVGVHFTIVTDHQCLTFLNSTQYYSARIQRWCLLLQQFDFSVEY